MPIEPHIVDKKATVFEALVRYALSKYGDEYYDISSDCPYETRMGGDRAFLQEVSWFVYEWINPQTGTTILEEFVAEKSSNAEQAARILLRKNVTHDKFEVVEDADAKGIITVRASSNGREYKMVAPKPLERYANGTEFLGRIHPRDEYTYMACGILTTPGEWDEDEDNKLTDDEYAKKFGLPVEIVKIARSSAELEAGRRSGLGRMGNIRRDAERCARMTDAVESRINERPDPQMVHDVLHGYLGKTHALVNVFRTTIAEGDDLKSVLMKYPIRFLRVMCRTLDIGSLPSRRDRVERICDGLPSTTCDFLCAIFPNDRRVLARILYKKTMPYPDCVRELLPLVAASEQIKDPDDPDAVKTIIYVLGVVGLLILGTGMLDGRIQRMVTVASDVRENILMHQGWREYVSSNLTSGMVETWNTDEYDKQITA